MATPIPCVDCRDHLKIETLIIPGKTGADDRCWMHYHRKKKGQDPAAPKQGDGSLTVPLRLWADVDLAAAVAAKSLALGLSPSETMRRALAKGLEALP